MSKLFNTKRTSNTRKLFVAATIAPTEKNSNDAVIPSVKYTKTRNQYSYRDGECNEGTAAAKIDLATNATGAPNQGRNQAFKLKIEELKDYRRLNGHLKIKRTKNKEKSFKQKQQGAPMCLQLTEEKENSLRAVGFLQDPCSKEGTVSSLGADIGPRNAAMAKFINCQQKLEQLMNKVSSVRIHPIILHLDQLVILFVVLQLGQMVILFPVLQLSQMVILQLGQMMIPTMILQLDLPVLRSRTKKEYGVEEEASNECIFR